jgi:hypothetical protein
MDAVTDALPRRSALLAAAAAGLAVPLARPGPAAVPGARDRAGQPESEEPEAGAGPVIAHVRDARTGEIDIFRGVTQVRVHDVALAAVLTRAAAR